MDTTEPRPPPVLCQWHPDARRSLLEPGETRVLQVELGPVQAVDQPDRQPGWEILTLEEQARALRFVRPRDGRRFMLCRAALRRALAQFLQVSAREVVFRFGPGGKPELDPAGLPRECQCPRFNVTHSGELALIALSLDRELGIDLESHRPISQAARIVESYFTTAEQAQFAGLDESVQSDAFLRGWTRKEAILKAKGVGLAGLATGFETMFGTTPLSGRFTPALPLALVGEWTLWEAAPRAGYVAALAVGDSSNLGRVPGPVESAASDPSLRRSPERP
jgi:4'-phosphopantetheinyl transferase